MVLFDELASVDEVIEKPRQLLFITVSFWCWIGHLSLLTFFGVSKLSVLLKGLRGLGFLKIPMFSVLFLSLIWQVS